MQRVLDGLRGLAEDRFDAGPGGEAAWIGAQDLEIALGRICSGRKQQRSRAELLLRVEQALAHRVRAFRFGGRQR